MSNELTIKVFKMNYEFLIKNYLNPEMWQKEWTLFEYKQYKVTMHIWSIQTRNEQILLDIRVHYVGDDDYKTYKERTINFSLKIEDVTFLKRQINSAIFDLMVMVEKESAIQNTDYYKELLQMRREEKKKLSNIATKFLDEAGVANDHLRETYIDAYIDEYSKLPDMMSDYIDSRIYKELPDLYLTWLSCLEDDPKKEIRTAEIKEKFNDQEWQTIMDKLDEYKAYMETEEFEEEMQSNLEEV